MFYFQSPDDSQQKSETSTKQKKQTSSYLFEWNQEEQEAPDAVLSPNKSQEHTDTDSGRVKSGGQSPNQRLHPEEGHGDEEESPEDTNQKSITIEMKISLKYSRYRNHKKVLYSPIKANHMMSMEIVRKKESFGSNFFVCRFDIDGEEYLMATKKCRNLKKETFQISMMMDFVEDIRNEPFYLGELIHRDGIYSLVDDGKFIVHCNQFIQRRMASFQITYPILGPGDIIALTPTVKEEEIAIIQANQLSELFKINFTENRIAKLNKFTNMSPSLLEALKVEPIAGCRQSKHTFYLQNVQSHQLTLALGRVNDLEFRARVYAGLSPFQAFGIIVGWLD